MLAGRLGHRSSGGKQGRSGRPAAAAAAVGSGAHCRDAAVASCAKEPAVRAGSG